MRDKRYELVEDDFIYKGKKLYRIRALKKIFVAGYSIVNKGDLGGYVEGYHNLSQDGSCWVYVGAKVYGNARVKDGASVGGIAEVFDNASIENIARVGGDAKVYSNARVSGTARVRGEAKVYGNAEVRGDSNVHGGAEIFDNADIFGRAEVKGVAKVYGNATVGGEAEVDGNAQYMEGAGNICNNGRYEV